jgi:hypothetical protein
VRCRKDIVAGAFIMEYVGEIITETMAGPRGVYYDTDFGRSFLFDLDMFDEAEDEPPPTAAASGPGAPPPPARTMPVSYTIDGTRKSNCCRYINHVRWARSWCAVVVCRWRCCPP